MIYGTIEHKINQKDFMPHLHMTVGVVENSADLLHNLLEQGGNQFLVHCFIYIYIYREIKHQHTNYIYT